MGFALMGHLGFTFALSMHLVSTLAQCMLLVFTFALPTQRKGEDITQCNGEYTVHQRTAPWWRQESIAK